MNSNRIVTMNVPGKGLLFRRVYEDLSRRIAEGGFPVDSQLPTESELMARYGVSITTVRKAMQLLADRGIVAKRQGAGTFVTAVPRTELSRPARRSDWRIGVFLPDTSMLREEGDRRHWVLNLRRLNGIYAKASQLNAAVLVHGFGEDPARFHLDGAVCMPAYAFDLGEEDLRRKLFERLDTQKVPYVTISEFDPRFASKYWVAELIEQEFFKAAAYLIGKGHRRIALLGPDLTWENPRYTAYRKALARAGLEFDEKLIFENAQSDSESAYRTAARGGGKNRLAGRADAILCTTDLQAYGVLRFLRENRIAVPDDISVMGVDNLPESETLPVPLTSLEFSGPGIGAKALELLIDVLSGRVADGVTMSFPGRIFERASVRERN